MSRPWEYEMARKFKKNKNNKKRVQTKNSFYFYMQEYNVTYLEGKVSDLRRLQELASPSWQQMGDEERKPYDVMANKARNNVDESRRSNPMEELLQQEAHKKEMMRLAIEAIESFVLRLDAATTLQTCEFYFFHANSYVRTATGIVVPCEVALCRYSITGGAIEVFDKIINIRPIPAGYAYEARATADATHHIPEKADFAETDVMKLYREMLQFLMPKTKLCDNLSEMANLQLELPPVYVTKTVAELAKECLGAIVVECMDCLPPDNDTGEPRLPMFNVFPIEELVHKITKKIISSVKMGNPEVSREEQEIQMFVKNPSCIYSKFFNDPYAQAPDTACKFHESVDCREYCSRSFVIRMAYIMSDCCCQVLGVRRLIWHHYPENYVIKHRHTEAVFLTNTPTSNIPPKYPRDEKHFINPIGDLNSSRGSENLLTESDSEIDKLLNPNRAAAARETKQVHLLPPTCSVLTDEEDADEEETCSTVSQAPTLSFYRDALDMSKVIKRREEIANSSKVIDQDNDSSFAEAQASSKTSAASKFNFDNLPERQYLERKRAEYAEEKREGRLSSFQTDTESVVSLPLERYNTLHKTKPDPIVQVAPEVPEVKQDAIPRRRRIRNYDPAQEENMIAVYNLAQKEKQALLSVAEGQAPQTPVPEPEVDKKPVMSEPLPPMSTQGNFNRGKKQGSAQEVSADLSSPTPIKQERVEEPSSLKAPIAAEEEEDVKPSVRWVQFDGKLSKEYEAKWMHDPDKEEEKQEVKPAPIKEEPMEVVDSVYFLLNEYNA